MLRRLFEAHLVEDDRIPTHLLDIGDYNVGILMPEPLFFLQVIAILLIQMCIANILTVLCYYGIIVNPSLSFIVTFGIVLPLTSWAPFLIMDMLDIQSTVLRMGLVALPICVSLKCLQAYFGYMPKGSTSSLHDFRCQMGFLMDPLLDNENSGHAVPTTRESLREALVTHSVSFLVTAFLASMLAPYSYEPFETSQKVQTVYWSLEYRHLMNNFWTAVLVSLSLSFSLSGGHALVQLVGGFQCQHVVDHPMLLSSSPSDFWGRRWNRLVHGGLKHGIYKPIRASTNSRAIATVATFLVSGLIHEYVWCVLFYQNVHQQDVYQPPFGKSLLFFGWNGILLVLEYAVIGETLWKRMASTVPRAVVTLIVVLMALPVSHLFTGDLIVGGYFQTLELALPIVIVTNKDS